MSCPICKHPGSADAETCAYKYRHPKPAPAAFVSARKDWVRPQAHDHHLNERVSIYALCGACNRESKVPTSKMLNGIFATSYLCPHCRSSVKVWARVTIAQNPVCEYDTDGDGNCHLCARTGGCRFRREWPSQSGSSAPDAKARLISEYLTTGMHHSTKEGRAAIARIISEGT